MKYYWNFQPRCVLQSSITPESADEEAQESAHETTKPHRQAYRIPDTGDLSEELRTEKALQVLPRAHRPLLWARGEPNPIMGRLVALLGGLGAPILTEELDSPKTKKAKRSEARRSEASYSGRQLLASLKPSGWADLVALCIGRKILAGSAACCL
jgi:hypothetical protein